MAGPRTTHQTKIVPPQLHGVVLRERLFRLLDGLQDYPVIWVSSPAGSGKTTLMASYARTRAIPTLWYRVDETDNDAATLFYYLRQAAKQLKKGRTRPLPLFTAEYRPGVSAFARRYFESLFERMATPGMIVFDNYQDAPETSTFHEIMLNGLRMVPEGIRVFVVSRKEPPPPFVSLQAESGLASLGWDAIRFTGNEVREMLQQHTKTTIPEETAQRIREQTQGWAAAVIFMLDGNRTWSMEANRIGDSSVFDYFRIEVFDGLDQRIKDFLAVTALLPTVSAGIASQLTELEKAGELLAYLNRNNYFTERYQDEYRYHPLFRDFLLSEAKRSLAPEKRREVQCRAGKLLLDSGRTEEGINLLIAAQDWDSVVPAALAAASGLVAEGRSQTLEGWIGSLPDEIRSGSPWLLYWLAVCRQPYDPDESRLLFDRCFTLCNQTGDTACTLLAWSGAVMSICIGQGQFRLLGPLIDWLDAFTARGGSFPSREIEATVACSMVAALMGYRPYHPEFRAWVDRAFMLSRSVVSASLRLGISLWVAGSYMWLGDYGRWAMVLEELEEMATSREPLQAIEWRFLKAMALNQMGPSDQSLLPLVEEGLKLSSDSGVIVWAPMLLLEGCYGALDRGDFRKASDFLAQMESMLGRAPKILDLRYHGVAALYHFLTGDTRRAVAHARQAITFSPDDVIFFPTAVGYCSSAILLAATGRRDEAREHIAAFRRLPQTTSRILEYTCLIAEAALALDEGAPDALDSIRRAFRIGREGGVMTPYYCWLPSLMSRLCSAALKAGIEVEHVRHMIRSRRLVPDGTAADIDAWPWAVKVFTLGGFEVRINDDPLMFTGKVQKRPLALLKVLIGLGGKDVPQDAIEDLLWPDAEGDAAHIAFKTALSRLRKLLNVDGAIEVKEGKLSLSKSSVWVDTRTLDSVAEQVSLLWEGRRTGTALAGADMASLLLGATYKGDFLKTDDEPWVRPYRDRLRSKYLRTVTRLIDIFTNAGEDESAIALYERAIDAGLSPDDVHHRSLRLIRPS